MNTLQIVGASWLVLIVVLCLGWYWLLKRAKNIDPDTFVKRLSGGSAPIAGKLSVDLNRVAEPRTNGVVIDKPIVGFRNPVWAIHQWLHAMGVDTDDASFMRHAQGREQIAVSLAGNKDVHDLCVAQELTLWINGSGIAQIGTVEELNT